MPKINATIFNMLVSCPSDVAAHISSIRSAVDKFNRHEGDMNNFFVCIKYYKDDTFPEMKNAQDSINAQLVDTEKIDIAVAMFWAKFGTPTKEYGSGTEEEINILKNNGKQVFVYFCKCRPDMNHLDAHQLQKVEKYQNKCSKDNNIYYSTYNSTNELEDKLYKHLSL